MDLQFLLLSPNKPPLGQQCLSRGHGKAREGRLALFGSGKQGSLQAGQKSQATHGQHLGVKSIQIAIKQTGAQAHWLTSTLASNQLASFACKFDQAQQAMARADRSQHKEESKDKTHYKERKHVT